MSQQPTRALVPQHGATPEEALRNLHRSLLKLYWRLEVDDDKARSEIAGNLVNALRLTEQSLVLGNDFLVAVAGPQGVGKTTLVREIYGLDEALFGGNLGRGERMPVVVREREGHQGPPRLWIRTLRAGGEAGGQVAEESVDVADPARWVKATRGQSDDVLVVGVDVPATFFGIEGMGFLLLPGYEQESRENRSWQELMRQAMLTSPSLIVVADQGRLAASQDTKVLEDLGAVTGDAIRPLLAVTRTEGMDEQTRDAVRARAAEVFGQNVAAADVVLTGAGDPQYRDDWAAELLDRLDIDRRNVSALRQRQLRQLERGLRDSLRGVFKQTKLELDKRAVGTPEATEYDESMKAFRDARDHARRDYEKHIDTILGIRFARAEEQLSQYLRETGGWNTLWSNVRGWLSARSSEVARDQNTTLLQIWNTSYDAAEIQRSAWAVQPLVVNRALAVQPDAVQPEAGRKVLPAGQLSTTIERAEQPMLDDLVFISGSTTAARDLQPSASFMAAVRLLPAIALENLAVVRDPGLLDLATHTSRGTADEDNKAFEQAINDMQQRRRLVIMGLGAVLGADLLADGNIDSIPAVAGAIQTALFGPAAGAGTAVAATTAATAVAAGVVGVAAAAAVISAADRVTSKRDARAQEILLAARAATRENLLQEFDDAVGFLEARLEARLRGYLELDAGAGRTLRLQGALAQAKEGFGALREACEEARGHLD